MGPRDRGHHEATTLTSAKERCERLGRPDLHAAGIAEAGGQHADHLIRLIVKLQRRPDGATVSSRELAPEVVAQDDNVRVTTLHVPGSVKAPEVWTNLEHIEEGTDRRDRGDTLWVAYVREVDTSGSVSGNRLEKVSSVDEVVDFSGRESCIVQGGRRDVSLDRHKVSDPVHRERVQDHRFDRTKNRRVRTDAENEREHCRDREAGGALEAPERRPKVLPQVSHISSFSALR